MAKKFAGFKPETMHNKILPALGYNGPKDQKSINAFLAASPSAAAKMGKYTMVARQMVEGKPVVNANIGTQIASLNGGGVSPSSLAASRQAAAAKAASGTPLESYQTGDVNSTAATRGGGGMPSGAALTTQIGQDPTKPVTVANVVSTDGGSAALIPQNTGQAGAANTAAVATGGTAAQAAAPTTTPAPQMTAARWFCSETRTGRCYSSER